MQIHAWRQIVHGVAQCLAGVALYHLWHAVPVDNYKKTDVRLPSFTPTKLAFI